MTYDAINCDYDPLEIAYVLEDFPLRIGGRALALIQGTAILMEDPGYEFTVVEIALDDVGDGPTILSENTDDEEQLAIFRDLANQICEHWHAIECFDRALSEARELA